MASTIASVENPEYPFDHLICIKLMDSNNVDRIQLPWSKLEPHCLAIDPFTRQICVLMVNDSLKYGEMIVYSQSGDFLRVFFLEKVKSTTHGMAVHRNNVYVVSGLSCFLQFKLADSITLIGSKNDIGSGIGEFMGPRQLDISNEGDLFVADFGNNRVQILDGNLQYKRHIFHYSMLNPCYLKLVADEVYVSGDSPEQSTNCIHIFTHMGEKLRSVILNVIPNSVRCRGFCIDTYGNVIITDNATHQIKFFTKEGNLFKTMDTFSMEARFMDEIIGVAWMANQKLVVLRTESTNIRNVFMVLVYLTFKILHIYKTFVNQCEYNIVFIYKLLDEFSSGLIREKVETQHRAYKFLIKDTHETRTYSPLLVSSLFSSSTICNEC